MTINHMAEHDYDHVRARLSSRNLFGAGLNLVIYVSSNTQGQVVQMPNAMM